MRERYPTSDQLDERRSTDWPESSVDIDDEAFAAAIADGRRERTAA